MADEKTPTTTNNENDTRAPAYTRREENKPNISAKVKKPTYYNRTFKHWNKFAESLNPGILSDKSKKRINDLGVVDPTKIIPTDKERDLSNEAKQQTKPPPKTIDYYNKLYKVKELTQLKNDLIIKLNNAPEENPDKIAIDTQLAIAHEKAAINLAKLKFEYDNISEVTENDTKSLLIQINYALKYGLFGKIITLNKHNNLDRTKSLETAQDDLKRALAYYEKLNDIHSKNPEKNIIDDLQYAKELAQHKSKYAEQLGSFMTKITDLESRNPQAVKDVKADVDALIDANQKVLNIENKIFYRKEPTDFNTPLSSEQAKLLKQAKDAMDTLDALIDTIVKKHADVATKIAKEATAAEAKATKEAAAAAAKLNPAPGLFSRLTTRSTSAPAITPATPAPAPVNIPISSEIKDMVERCKSLMSEISQNDPNNRILLRQLAKHLIILVTLINQK